MEIGDYILKHLKRFAPSFEGEFKKVAKDASIVSEDFILREPVNVEETMSSLSLHLLS